ncbi:hypothetical protein [Collimonas humicola]|uniref:hypothetical protein n=1 Tax=Collimonas humicola TaxID=2825886 RepID=UPI001B8D17F8|nr:hypothetical protein [Collimonas humicola]
MASEQELAQWLQAQPLNAAVVIDDESVYLNVYPNGAELGVCLTQAYTQDQLQRALRQGFSSAIHFDAGLGLSADGNSLVLTQWLQDVANWPQAAPALEHLLNQLAPWRAALAPVETAPAPSMHGRLEQRLRLRLAQRK